MRKDFWTKPMSDKASKMIHGIRRYNSWAGDPAGMSEDTSHCIAKVSNNDRTCMFHQCQFPRGKGPKGLYCGKHAAILAKGGVVWIPKLEKNSNKG